MFIKGLIKKDQIGFSSAHDYIKYVKKENDGAFFLPMLIVGLPNVPACAEIVMQLERNGAKMIELFLPTHDAFLENHTITKAMDKALAGELYMADCFDMVSLVRQRGCKIPLILRSYFSSVFNYGLSKFVRKCHLSGINILNIQNLPLAKIHEIAPYLKRNNIEFTCEFSKVEKHKQVLAINNPASNISMLYKNLLAPTRTNKNGVKISSIQDNIETELTYLQEITTKEMAICGSFNVSDNNDIKNLLQVINLIDLFTFKSHLTNLQYIQANELEKFQDKPLYEQNQMLINRVVEKAIKYININKLIDDYQSTQTNTKKIIDTGVKLDFEKLLNHEITADVIDLKTKEERQQEKEQAAKMQESLDNRFFYNQYKKKEIYESVDTTFLDNIKKKE